MSSTQRSMSGERQLAGPLDRDAVGDRQRRVDADRLAGRSDAGNGAHASACTPIDPTSGRARLDRDRDAAGQPAAADRDDDRARSGDVLEQLEAERPLPGDDVGVVERVHERHAGLARRARAAAATHRRPTRRRDHVAPSAARASTLAIGASRGMKTSHGTPRTRGGERQRLGVVAGAAGDDAARARVAERGELAQRAADLEGAGALQVLRLEHDRRRPRARRSSRTTGPACGARRRAPPHERRRRPRAETVRVHAAYGTATTASKPTSAPRGSDATPNA